MNEEEKEEENSPKYSWDETYQRDVLALLLHDRSFLVQAIDLIKPEYFVNKAHELISKILFDFFKKYRGIPKKSVLEQEIKNKVRNEKTLFYYLGELVTVSENYVPGLDSRDYLLDKVTTFAKIQALRLAYAQTGQILEKNPEDEETWDKVYEMLRQAMTVSKNFEVGLEYFKNKEDRYERLEQRNNPSENFITGFESIDSNLRAGGLRRGEIGAVVAGSGVGKCHGYGTPILMYDGTIKKVQDIKVGDKLMGDDSTPRTVLCLHHGIDEMYDVIPTKGERYSFTEDHILVLKSSSKKIDCNGRCVNTRYHNSEWKNKQDNIFEIPISEFLNNSKRFQRTMKIFRQGVNFPYKEIKINPYVLGVWLGEGTSSNTDVTTQDFDVLNELWHESSRRGLDVNEKPAEGNAKTYSLCKRGIKNNLLEDFRFYNLIKNKHIPHVYKTNSREVRLQLLAGLIDTDGSKQNNCYDFINKNKRLAEDVVYLARSLGLAAYMKPCRKKAQTQTEKGLYWRVCISGNCEEIPVRIKYKKCNKRLQIKDVLVSGFRIEKRGKGEYFGFSTDGNHRYLLGDFTVVHNSLMLSNITAANVRRGKRVVYISLELDEDAISERFDAIFTGEPIALLSSRKNIIFEELDKIVEDYEDKNLIIIKDFPAGTANTDTLRAYLAQLSFYGFKPDMGIVDYVGEMKNHTNLKTYESRERSIRELRALAKEEDIAIFTAMQLNRGHKDAEEGAPIDDRYLADSFGQTRPLDGCWSVSVSKIENDLDIGSIYAIKHRDGKSKFGFHIEFNKTNLQIKEISKDTYLQRRSLYKDRVMKDIMIDNVDNQLKLKKKKKRKEEVEEDYDEELKNE